MNDQKTTHTVLSRTPGQSFTLTTPDGSEVTIEVRNVAGKKTRFLIHAPPNVKIKKSGGNEGVGGVEESTGPIDVFESLAQSWCQAPHNC